MGAGNFDLAVAGAGVMGMGCALEEARRGKRVAVFDPAGIGLKASWAAAGILVTRDARIFTSPFREFYVRSIHAYPAWLEGIAKLSGQTVPLHRGGDYQVYDVEGKRGREQWEAKLRQLEREHSRDYTISESLPSFLRDLSPLHTLQVLHFPGEAFVQNRDLLAALHSACLQAGVEFLTGHPLQAWNFRNGLSVLDFADTRWEARQLLIAAGAWTGRFLEAMGVAAPMVPVKGQLMRIPKFHAGESMVHFGEEIYLVPRGDSLVVGATTEAGVWEEGFDGTGSAYLETHIRHYLPETDATPLEQWTGLRPRTRDRLPLMGWVDAEKGVAICTGHYKCGISMAPLAALCLSKLLNGEKPPIDLAPFHPWRAKGLVHRGR